MNDIIDCSIPYLLEQTGTPMRNSVRCVEQNSLREKRDVVALLVLMHVCNTLTICSGR